MRHGCGEGNLSPQQGAGEDTGTPQACLAAGRGSSRSQGTNQKRGVTGPRGSGRGGEAEAGLAPAPDSSRGQEAPWPEA